MVFPLNTSRVRAGLGMPWHGSVGRCEVWRGRAWHGRARISFKAINRGRSGHASARLGSAAHGVARQDVAGQGFLNFRVWLGRTRRCMALLGGVLSGRARHGKDSTIQNNRGTAAPGGARHGLAGMGTAPPGTARQGFYFQTKFAAGSGTALLGLARQCSAPQVIAVFGSAGIYDQ